MSMFKTTTAKTPGEYIGQLAEPRRTEIKKLHGLIRQTAPNLEPRIMSGMIGYGTYHYKYLSGREGDWALVSLASQKNYISLYVMCVIDGKYLAETYKNQLPGANIGKSCISFKRLSDVDINVIREIIRKAVAIGPMADATK